MTLVIKYETLFPPVELPPVDWCNHTQLFLFSARENTVLLTILGNKHLTFLPAFGVTGTACQLCSIERSTVLQNYLGAHVSVSCSCNIWIPAVVLYTNLHNTLSSKGSNIPVNAEGSKCHWWKTCCAPQKG